MKLFPECDASGIGAGFTLALEQDTDESFLTAKYLANLLPITFGSQTFTDCEKHYPNIEWELLAVVCGIEKFNYYTFGRNTVIFSDHKPMSSIILKDLINAPSRLQRMLIRLQKYKITVVYCKDSEIVFVDHLSRNLNTKHETGKIKELDKLSIANVDLNISQVKLSKIQEKSKLDPELIQVSMLIVFGWPDRQTNVSELARPYWNFRDELNVLDGVFLKGNHIIVPKLIRTDVLKQIHEGHLGVSKCQLRARTSVYGPGVNDDISDLAGQCETCQLG